MQSHFSVLTLQLGSELAFRKPKQSEKQKYRKKDAGLQKEILITLKFRMTYELSSKAEETYILCCVVITQHSEFSSEDALLQNKTFKLPLLLENVTSCLGMCVRRKVHLTGEQDFFLEDSFKNFI